MARRTGLISTIVREMEKAEKQRAAEEKRRQALIARMEREHQKEQRMKERELIQWSKVQAARQQKLDKQQVEIDALLDRYQSALQRYDLLMQQIPEIQDDMPPSYIDLGITLLKEAISYVPELLDFHQRLHCITQAYLMDGGKDWENEFSGADYAMPFLLLSDFYMQCRRYRYAIQTCQDAISMGLESRNKELTFQTLLNQIKSEMEEHKHG